MPKYKNVDNLMQKLSTLSDVEATEELTKFFVNARFQLSDGQFNRQYVDGKDDGGIDFYHVEDDTFYILQTKFSSKSRKTDQSMIPHELSKLDKTINLNNTNARAEEFVNTIKRNIGTNRLLEVIWITTNLVDQNVVDAAQRGLNEIKRRHGWTLDVDFVPFDRNALQRMIFDIAHGYIPYTGRQTIEILGKYIENQGEATGVYSFVCTVKVNDLLRWFKQRADVKKYLQKNIRDYVGETKINRGIRESYVETPDWFWYKHNGIIIFADSIAKTQDESGLILRNPQVVNGGQSLIELFSAFDRAQRKDTTAEVLARFYRLPYEDSETYKKSIDIIKALNSQNPIRASDLHSTDPRQVVIEALMKQMGYMYLRKRGKEVKSGHYSITMRNLALYYHVCKTQSPHEGVIAEVEEIFEEETKYDAVFPETAINRELSMSHVVMNYITVWNIAEALDRFLKDLNKYTRELSQYTWYFVLADIYRKLLDWRTLNFELPGWRSWKDFVESDEFQERLWRYSKRAFETARDIVPRNEEPRKFFRTKEATRKFAMRTHARGVLNVDLNRALYLFKSRQD